MHEHNQDIQTHTSYNNYINIVTIHHIDHVRQPAPPAKLRQHKLLPYWSWPSPFRKGQATPGYVPTYIDMVWVRYYFAIFLILINWLQLQSNVYGVYFGLLPYMLNSSTWTSCVTLNSAYERWSGYFKVKTKGLEAAFGCWICLLMPTGIFNNNIHHDNCIPVYVAVSHSVQTLPRFRVGSGLFIKMTIFLRLLMIFSISYRSEAGKFVLLC